MLRTISIRMVLILAPIDTEEEVNGTALVGKTGVTGGVVDIILNFFRIEIEASGSKKLKIDRACEDLDAFLAS